METNSHSSAFSTLKILIITEWFLVVAAVILSFTLITTLPPLLKDWLESEAERNLATFEIVTSLTLAPLLFGSITASIGLFFRKEWAVKPYVVFWVILLFASLFLGPTVEAPLTSVLGDCTTLLGGIIIGIILFTDAIPRRSKKN